MLKEYQSRVDAPWVENDGVLDCIWIEDWLIDELMVIDTK